MKMDYLSPRVVKTSIWGRLTLEWYFTGRGNIKQTVGSQTCEPEHSLAAHSKTQHTSQHGTNHLLQGRLPPPHYSLGLLQNRNRIWISKSRCTRFVHISSKFVSRALSKLQQNLPTLVKLNATIGMSVKSMKSSRPACHSRTRHRDSTQAPLVKLKRVNAEGRIIAVCCGDTYLLLC